MKPFTKLDVNKYLQDSCNNQNLNTESIDGVKVIDANLAQITRYLKKYYGFSNLLTTSKSQNKLGKTFKELGIFSIGVSLAPFTSGKVKLILESGNYIIDLCNHSTPSCRKTCVIANAGNPAYLKGKLKAMNRRTEFLIDKPRLFLAVLLRLVELKAAYCIKNGFKMTMRGNIASDIDYESISVIYKNHMAAYSNVIDSYLKTTSRDSIMYDYTKNPNRHQDSKYFKAYSVTDYDNSKIEKALKNGLPLAMVFDTPRNKTLPPFYSFNINGVTRKLPIVDGDSHDYLPESKKLFKDNFYIYGLRFKHKASHNKEKRQQTINRHLLSGFIRHAAAA